ncbi:MAG: hypothetical protein ACLPKB_16785 [Xanthobacteraceae bacterium]
MISPTIRALTVATVFAAFPIAFVSTANATPFDGTWNVRVSTTSGPCGQSYTYSVTITHGVVSSEAGLSGRVTENGNLSVTVSDGSQSAHGSGRLVHNGGGGTWHGSGPSGTCSGSWSAERA